MESKSSSALRKDRRGSDTVCWIMACRCHCCVLSDSCFTCCTAGCRASTPGLWWSAGSSPQDVRSRSTAGNGRTSSEAKDEICLKGCRRGDPLLCHCEKATSSGQRVILLLLGSVFYLWLSSVAPVFHTANSCLRVSFLLLHTSCTWQTKSFLRWKTAMKMYAVREAVTISGVYTG